MKTQTSLFTQTCFSQSNNTHTYIPSTYMSPVQVSKLVTLQVLGNHITMKQLNISDLTNSHIQLSKLLKTHKINFTNTVQYRLVVY